MKYVETFRVSKVVFNWLLQLCRVQLEFETANTRSSLSKKKQLAILLHWLGHGFAESQLATLYRVGSATVNGILRSSGEAVMTCLVPISIRFPVGQAQRDQMLEVEAVSGLPLCAGAVDGTFMRIQKPVEWWWWWGGGGGTSTGITNHFQLSLSGQLARHKLLTERF